MINNINNNKIGTYLKFNNVTCDLFEIHTVL